MTLPDPTARLAAARDRLEADLARLRAVLEGFDLALAVIAPGPRRAGDAVPAARRQPALEAPAPKEGARKARRALDAAGEARLAELWGAEATMAAIAGELKISATAIKTVLRRLGLPRRRPGRRRRPAGAVPVAAEAAAPKAAPTAARVAARRREAARDWSDRYEAAQRIAGGDP